MSIHASNNPAECSPIIIGDSLFLGSFLSLTALQTAHSAPADGAYANIVIIGQPSDLAVWNIAESAYSIFTGQGVSFVQNNTPLYIEVTLPATDVSDLVTYINTLDPPLVISETVSLVQIKAIGTNDMFQFVNIGKGTYGLGETTITPEQVLKISFGSTIPTFQQVTDVEDPITTNAVGSTSAFYVGAFIDWLSGNAAASFMAMYADMGMVIKDYGPKAPMIFKNKLNDNTVTLVAQNKPEADYLIADTEDIAALQAQITAGLEGLSWKNNARIAIDTALTMSGSVPLTPTLTIQGVTLVQDDRVVLMAQANPIYNGIYRVNAALTSGNYRLYRTNDANATSELNNALVPIGEGTYVAKTFRQTTVNPVINTSSILFEIFGSSVANATETVAGIAEIATTAEVATGTDDTRIVTPLKLKAVTDLKANNSVATTGSVISFDVNKIYNTFSTPTTADITNDLTNAKIGVVQKIYSNKAVEPTYPLGWVKIGGDYTVSVVNIIYAEWSEGSRVEYWIIKG